MKCPDCGAEMEASKEPYPYKESGLPNVVLVGIEVLRCPKCEGVVARIPDMRGLHETIARHVAKLDRRLVPAELAFLDKFVGYNATDSRSLHLRDEMSGWPRTTLDARRHVELYLRLLTLLTLGDEFNAVRELRDDMVYALATAAEVDETPETERAQAPEQRFLRSKDHWEPRALLAG